MWTEIKDILGSFFTIILLGGKEWKRDTCIKPKEEYVEGNQTQQSSAKIFLYLTNVPLFVRLSKRIR
jgi:hypothetical protein